MPMNALAGSPQAADESALQAFVATLPPDLGVAARTLAHAWAAAGGTHQAGRLTVRLLATAPNGRPFTAATVHGPASGAPRLEVARVLLVSHGVAALDWTAWCDERPELTSQGFDPAAKYPCVPLTNLSPAAVARLALALRDLCRLAQGQGA